MANKHMNPDESYIFLFQRSSRKTTTIDYTSACILASAWNNLRHENERLCMELQAAKHYLKEAYLENVELTRKTQPNANDN